MRSNCCNESFVKNIIYVKKQSKAAWRTEWNTAHLLPTNLSAVSCLITHGCTDDKERECLVAVWKQVDDRGAQPLAHSADRFDRQKITIQFSLFMHPDPAVAVIHVTAPTFTSLAPHLRHCPQKTRLRVAMSQSNKNYACATAHTAYPILLATIIHHVLNHVVVQLKREFYSSVRTSNLLFNHRWRQSHCLYYIVLFGISALATLKRAWYVT